MSATHLITAERLRGLPYPIAVALAFGWMFAIEVFVSPVVEQSEFPPAALEFTGPLAVFLAIACLGRTFSQLVPPAPLFLVLSIAALAAMLGYLLAPSVSNSIVLSWIVLAVICFYHTTAIIACYCYLATVDLVDCMLLIFLWQLLVALLRLLSIFAVPSELISLFTPLVVLLCFQALPAPKSSPKDCVAADASVSVGDDSASLIENEGEALSRRFPTLLIAVNVLVVFCINALHGFSPDGFSNLSFFGTFVAILILAIFLAVNDRIVRLRQLYVVSLVLLELALMAFALNAPAGTGAAMMMLDASYVVFSAFFFTVLCNTCRRHQLPPARTFAIAYAAEYLAALLGWILSANLGMGVKAFPLVVMAVLGSFALTVFPAGGLSRRARSASDAEQRYLDPAAYFQSLEALCSSIAMQFSLSRRETDVLLLLAQRKSAAQIADVLVISQATAKSHIHNIYKKLGVHSRKELFTFIGQPENDAEAPGTIG